MEHLFVYFIFCVMLKLKRNVYYYYIFFPSGFSFSFLELEYFLIYLVLHKNKMMLNKKKPNFFPIFLFKVTDVSNL